VIYDHAPRRQLTRAAQRLDDEELLAAALAHT
jgi:hypothetical protein